MNSFSAEDTASDRMGTVRMKRSYTDYFYRNGMSIKTNYVRLYRTAVPGTGLRDDQIHLLKGREALMNNTITDLCIYGDDGTIVICEAQSTWPISPEFRFLTYYVDAGRNLGAGWQKGGRTDERFRDPTFAFCMVYTGSGHRETGEITHTKAFPTDRNEIAIRILRGDDPSEGPVYEYVQFLDILEDNRIRYDDDRKALEETINYCVEHNIFREYLEEKREEIMNDADSYFTAEDDLQRVVYQARLEEREEHENAVMRIIEGMLMNDIPVETIARITGKDAGFISGIRDSM